MNTKHVLVIGDVMIDKYLWGDSTRNSPEANVPVLDLSKTESSAGGAANVALCLCQLQLNVSVIGVVGKDQYAHELRALLEANKAIRDITLLEDSTRPTTVKTRIISGTDHLLRVDHESTECISPAIEDQIIDSFTSSYELNKFEAVVLQDYDKGVFTERLISKILSFCEKNDISTLVDPKYRNFYTYSPVTLFKPNLKELGIALSKNLENLTIEELAKEVSTLAQKIQSKYFLLTLGERGMLLNFEEKCIHVPAKKIEKPDVCGAGDAVLAAASKALLEDLEIEAFIKHCNSAGYESCLEVGVNPSALQKMTKKSRSLYEDIKIKYV